MEKKPFKTVEDLVAYMNGTGLFKEQPVESEDVYTVFEKAGLFMMDFDRGCLIPTPFMHKTGGVFASKSGKILFHEWFFQLMTQDTEYYTAYQWCEWFADVYNRDDDVNYVDELYSDEAFDKFPVKINKETKLLEAPKVINVEDKENAETVVVEDKVVEKKTTEKKAKTTAKKVAVATKKKTPAKVVVKAKAKVSKEETKMKGSEVVKMVKEMVKNVKNAGLAKGSTGNGYDNATNVVDISFKLKKGQKVPKKSEIKECVPEGFKLAGFVVTDEKDGFWVYLKEGTAKTKTTAKKVVSKKKVEVADKSTYVVVIKVGRKEEEHKTKAVDSKTARATIEKRYPKSKVLSVKKAKIKK